MQVRIADYLSLLSVLSPRKVLCQHRATALDADSTARVSVVRATRTITICLAKLHLVIEGCYLSKQLRVIHSGDLIAPD